MTHSPFGALTPTRDAQPFRGQDGRGPVCTRPIPLRPRAFRPERLSRFTPGLQGFGGRYEGATRGSVWSPGVAHTATLGGLFSFCAVGGGAWRRGTLHGTEARKATGRGRGLSGVSAPALQGAHQAGPGSVCGAAPRPAASLLASSAGAAPRDQAPDIQRAGRDRPETRPDLARAPLSRRKQQSVCDPRAGGREDPPRRAWASLARGRQWHVWPKRELWTGAGPEEVGIAGRRGTAPRCGPLLCLPRRWTVLWGTGGGASSQAHDRGALPSPGVLATLAPGAALRPLARWGRGYPSPFLPLRKQRPQFPARRPSHPRPACAAGCALPGCSRVLGPRAGLPSPRPAACAALQGARGAGWGAAVGFGRDQGELGAPRVQGDGGLFSRSPGRRRPGALPGSAVPPALRLSGLRP